MNSDEMFKIGDEMLKSRDRHLIFSYLDISFQNTNSLFAFFSKAILS